MSLNLPKVAIVLPIYNVSSYLIECLTSIKDQTYKNIIVFAIDDGSTDKSGEILDDFAKSFNKIKITHKLNGGVSSARNKALDLIDAENDIEYVCFVDSDDYLENNFIETFVSYMQKSNANVACCAFYTFDKASRKQKFNNKLISVELSCDDLADLFFGYEKKNLQLAFHAKFLLNKFFKYETTKGLRFNENLKIGEDQEYFLRMLPRCTKNICVPYYLYNYRLRKSSLTTVHNNIYKSDTYLFQYLLNHSRDISPAVRKGLELSLLDSWWQRLRVAYINKDLEGKNKAKEIYNWIKEHHFIAQIPSLYKKRFLMYSVGDLFLTFYFALRTNKANKQKNYFS